MHSLSRKPKKNRLYFDAIYMSVQLLEFAYEIGELGMDFEIAQQFQREAAAPGFDALYALVVLGTPLFQSRDPFFIESHARTMAAAPSSFTDCSKRYGVAPYACHIMSAPDDV